MEAVDWYDGDDAGDVCVTDIDGEFDDSEDVDIETARFPSCRSGLCEPLFCVCGRIAEPEDVSAEF